MFPLGNNGQGPPPSPGYYPSSRIGSIGFNQGFRNLWGPQHQRLDQGALTIWLDRSSGSGFKSVNPYSSGFFVDDVPIRRYPRKSDATFPLRPMWVYGSIWDASSWATENGRYKADYNYQPFVGKYTNFKISGCNAYGSASCRPASGSPSPSGGLSSQQYAAMEWVQRNYKVYDYCRDPQRDHRLTPEC
ncbi:UNVERIFIED_CONTAM: putative xyloglucan endotransglucosylase/hydrolase protein 32 [Sesamum calycinum]|uniref:xyloglucan:xyloglucosyl transferase n=1 Tax=Sesamum calycinum TaxID=2727403 RepID=A0AAW2SDH8_9LAMI